MMRITGFGIRHSRLKVRTLGRRLILPALLLLAGLWCLSPGFGQVSSGTPTYNVNAKWVTDHGSQVYNIKAYGACGNDTCDDTAAIQSVYNQFCNHLRGGTGVVGQVFWPIGTYKITNHIVSCGSVYTVGAGSEVGNGAVIDWHGPSYDTPFIMYAAYEAELRDLGINTNGVAPYAVHIVADNTVSTTSSTTAAPGLVTATPASMNNIAVGTLLGINVTQSDAELVYVTAVTGATFTANFANAHSGTWTIGNGGVTEGVKISGVKIVQSGTSSGIAIGNVVGAPNYTPEVSEIVIDNITVTGGGTSGIVQLAGDNVGDVWIYNPKIWATQYGINLGACSFTDLVSGGNFENVTVADMSFGGNCSVTVSGVYSEPGGADNFILGLPSMGSSPSNITVLNSIFASNSSTATTISSAGNLTLIGNTFNPYGGNAKIVAGGGIINNGGQITSISNFYGGAATWAPFYDGSNNPLLPTYYAHQPVTVTSIADMGGYADTTKTPLTNYGLAGVLTDSAMGAGQVAGTGLLRGGDTSCLLGFRNHAGSADLTVCKNTSDQILATTPLGGTQLVSTASGVPPIVVNSATAVPTLTVQNCANCNVTGSMNVNGGTPITGMSTFQTGSITPSGVSGTSCSDQTFTVSGLALASTLSNVVPPAALGNLSLNAYVSAANMVLLHFCNPSATSVTPPAGNYSFLATQPQRYSHVQGALAQSTTQISSPFALTLPANPTQGNLVVVAFGVYRCVPVNLGTITLTDGNSNSYTILSTAANTSNTAATTMCGASGTMYGRLYIAYLLSAPSNASSTLTLSWSSGNQNAVNIWADEFYALGGGASYDSTAGVAAVSSRIASGTSITSPSITASQAGELLYSAGMPTPEVNSCQVTGPGAGSVLSSWIGAAGGIAAGRTGISYPGGTGAEYDLSANGATAVNYTVGCSGATYAAIAAAFK